MNQLTAIGVIPARYHSTRLPGKPLEMIGKKTMIQLVAEQAAMATRLSDVIIATDDNRIAAVVSDFGGRAVMSPMSIQSGTDRAAFVTSEIETDIVVNIQGDEPFIDPASIDRVVTLLEEYPEAEMGTLVRPIEDVKNLHSSHTVKVVRAQDGSALYFSRSPIPFCRDSSEQVKWLREGVFLQHIGLYSYRKIFLQQFSKCNMSLLEQCEKLEQLRALELGATIQVAVTDSLPFGIDTREDLERARDMIRQN